MSELALAILAAGASSRLGTCKALVDLGGRTPLARLLEAGAGLRGAPPLVVTGADHEALARAAPATCELARNPSWEAGRTGGVALAGRLRPGLDLCLAPVDVPLVPRALFEALARAWVEQGAPQEGWLAPRSTRGRRPYGHPVVVGRGLLLHAAHLPASSPLREIRERAHPLLSVPFSGHEPWDDLDTPADLEFIRQRLASTPR